MTYFMISADRRGTPLWWSVAAGDFVEVQDNGTQFVRDRDAATLASRVGMRPNVTNARVVEVGANLADKHPGAIYVADCLRTEYTPDFIAPRLNGDMDAIKAARMMSRMIHAVLGLMSEVGEIADQLKKNLIYGKPLDLVNLVEELGDESWYQSLFLDAIGSSWEQAWTKNIAKLRARYPEKFTREQALHRDLDVERAVLEGDASLDTPSVTVTFVVNGEDVKVENILRENGATIRLSILGAIRIALERSNNTSRPSDDWELRDQHGVMIEGARWGASMATLQQDGYYYLTLKLGAGGTAVQLPSITFTTQAAYNGDVTTTATRTAEGGLQIDGIGYYEEGVMLSADQLRQLGFTCAGKP